MHRIVTELSTCAFPLVDLSYSIESWILSYAHWAYLSIQESRQEYLAGRRAHFSRNVSYHRAPSRKRRFFTPRREPGGLQNPQTNDLYLRSTPLSITFATGGRRLRTTCSAIFLWHSSTTIFPVVLITRRFLHHYYLMIKCLDWMQAHATLREDDTVIVHLDDLLRFVVVFL